MGASLPEHPACSGTDANVGRVLTARTTVVGRNEVAGHFDILAWIVTVLCMVGLTITLSGSWLGAVLFVAAGGLLAVTRADQCLHLIFRSLGLWLVPAFA